MALLMPPSFFDNSALIGMYCSSGFLRSAQSLSVMKKKALLVLVT